MAKRERYYNGVWSNDKKTFDLDYLNTGYEMEGIKSIVNNSSSGSTVVYVTKSGTLIQRDEWEELDDWFADLGAITHKEVSYKVLGRNFKLTKENGLSHPEFIKFMNCMNNNDTYKEEN